MWNWLTRVAIATMKVSTYYLPLVNFGVTVFLLWLKKKLVNLDKNQSQITFLRLDERNWMFCFCGIFFK